MNRHWILVSWMHLALLIALLFMVSLVHAKMLPDAMEDERVQSRWMNYMKAPQQKISAEFPHLACFRQSATRHRLPLPLLLAVARGESNFESRARSKANALGLMQILWPQTAAHLGIRSREALFDPCTNVDAGARYLRELMDRYGDDLHRTLAAYNYGPGRIPLDRGKPIPSGASWYSRYIQRHLDYVLSRDGRETSTGGRRVLIHFSRPYRAAALVERIQPLLGSVRIDWFRQPQGGFDVVLEYHDQAQLKRSRSALSKLGFSL